jgi:membrane associated rhomboid family serine protease
MGLESRDYYRDGSYTATLAGWGIDFTPVVKYLIITNVIVFLLQIFFTRPAVEVPNLGELARKQAEAQKRTAAKEDEADEDDPMRREENDRKAREILEELTGQLPGARRSVVQDWLELDPTKTIEKGQLWRLVTCAFCHDRLAVWHILFNMLLLYWFGTRLERMYGSREFLLFYLGAAVCGSLAYVGLAYYTGSKVPAIGASGAVMGVMMLYVIFYPFETILLFWLIPVPLWVLLGLYVVYDLHPVLLALAGDRLYSQVAHAGHLGGLAFGLLYWRLGLRLEAPFTRRIGRPRRKREPQPLEEPAILSFPRRDDRDDLAEQVDEVLRKISEQGRDSLTDEELAILQKASAKYREGK